MEGVMYQNALMDINRQLHFTILTVWINTWGLNEFILVFCSSEVLTGLNRLKTKQTNKQEKKKSCIRWTNRTSETTASAICTDSTLGLRHRHICTKNKNSIHAAIFNTAQSHCRLQRGWLKRKGKGLSGTLYSCIRLFYLLIISFGC